MGSAGTVGRHDNIEDLDLVGSAVVSTAAACGARSSHRKAKTCSEAKRHCSEPTFWTSIAAHLGREGYSKDISLSCLEIINEKRIHGRRDRGSPLITAPRRSCSPPAIGNRSDNRSATDVLRKLRRPSASRSRSFHLNFFSEPASKSMRRDTTAGEFVGCTKAQTTPWCAAGRLSALHLAAKRGDEASAWAVNVSGVKAATFFSSPLEASYLAHQRAPTRWRRQ